MASNIPATALTLFPLQAVLFPGGLLSLKVFEPRYVGLVAGQPRIAPHGRRPSL